MPDEALSNAKAQVELLDSARKNLDKILSVMTTLVEIAEPISDVREDTTDASQIKSGSLLLLHSSKHH